MSFHCPLTHRADVIGFNEIFVRLSLLKLGVYTPVSYILPSRIAKYEAMYDTEVSSGGGTLKQHDREQSLRALMTVNLLKRLESSVAVVPDHASEASGDPPSDTDSDRRLSENGTARLS